MKSVISTVIKRHEALRSRGINLIASENYLSPNVRQALVGDLAGRYHSRWYGGSRIAREIIGRTEVLARKLFKAKHALVLPLSGNICDIAVVLAFTRPNDKVAMLPFTRGGYPLGLGKIDRKRVNLPADRGFRINIEKSQRLIREHRIKLTILGASYILFPQPVREFSRMLKKVSSKNVCVYDGSHVMGLLASGEFQRPLVEGADVIIGSTHKTLYGPQGGIILTNSDQHARLLNSYLELDLVNGIGLVDNAHVNRMAALGVALEEMLADRTYGRRVITNAQTLARMLELAGVPVLFRDRGYTRSHQILLDIKPARAVKLCSQLEKIGIFADQGGRLGTAEITHRGIKLSQLEVIAEIIAEVYHKGVHKKLAQKVRQITRSFK